MACDAVERSPKRPFFEDPRDILVYLCLVCLASEVPVIYLCSELVEVEWVAGRWERKIADMDYHLSK
jgi:hypothetical protein